MISTQILVWLLPLPPALAFILISLFTYRRRALSHTLAVGAAALSWLAAMVVFIQAISIHDLGTNPIVSSIPWLPMGSSWMQIGIQIDPLSTLTLFFVAWTVLMIFIYSIGYHNFGSPVGDHDQPGLPPHGRQITTADGHKTRVVSVEPMYARFFAFISLFSFAMFLLVVTDNLLIFYLAWEIMGLCSYLLIGFWYSKPSARDAAVKAFMTTRVGDMFMMIGLVALYAVTGSLNYRDILSNAALLNQLAGAVSPIAGLSWAGLIGLLLFAGTVGKSAQFPLHVWLPDAMEGPTPVSAMIHAATMVSAGVYLSIRFFPLLSAGWSFGEPVTLPMLVMAAIGSFTALFAATIALAQNDIKRVLAYSTISQLGYMVAALGVGAYVAAAFHLMTHAFFKALLFLGSGSVIHGMEHGVFHSGEEIDPQNMLNMGGLRRRMPVTFATFLIGGMALSGFPLITAGFWSKDEILASAFGSGAMVVFVLLALAALLTAFYTMRQITLTFLGAPRTQSAAHAHETTTTMTLPLVVLSVFAVSAGWFGIPAHFPWLGGLIPNWIEEFFASMPGEHLAFEFSIVPLLTSVVVALGGLSLGWLFYRNIRAGQPDSLERDLGPIYLTLRDKYYFDEVYHAVLVRPANWLAKVFTARWVDKFILDGIVHDIGRAGLAIGRFLRRAIDIPIVNGTGDAVSTGTRRFGSNLRGIQTGRIQQYLASAILAAVVMGVLFYFFVLV